MAHEQSAGDKVARLNTRGVAAINRNDYKLARQYFSEAYKLDSRNAFALTIWATSPRWTATGKPPTFTTTRRGKPTNRA